MNNLDQQFLKMLLDVYGKDKVLYNIDLLSNNKSDDESEEDTKSLNNIIINYFNGNIRRMPIGFWEDHNNMIAAFRYLLFKKYKFNRDDICREFTCTFLSANRLHQFRRCQLHQLLYIVAPELKILPWELGSVPKNYWNDDTIRDALKWLIDDKLKLKKEDLCRTCLRTLMRSNGLVTLGSSKKYTNLDYLNLLYPGEFVKVTNMRYKLR